MKQMPSRSTRPGKRITCVVMSIPQCRVCERPVGALVMRCPTCGAEDPRRQTPLERINVVMLCTDGNVRKGCVVQERFGEVNVRYSFVTGSGYFTGGYAKKVKGRWIDVAGPPTLKDGRWRQP